MVSGMRGESQSRETRQCAEDRRQSHVTGGGTSGPFPSLGRVPDTALTFLLGGSTFLSAPYCWCLGPGPCVKQVPRNTDIGRHVEWGGPEAPVEAGLCPVGSEATQWLDGCHGRTWGLESLGEVGDRIITMHLCLRSRRELGGGQREALEREKGLGPARWGGGQGLPMHVSDRSRRVGIGGKVEDRGESLARYEASGSGGDCGKVGGRPLPQATAPTQLLAACENWGYGYQIFKF